MPIEVEITLEGDRIQPWLHRPVGGLLERLEWLTDVLEAEDGSEQSIRLRGAPRRFFEFAIMVEGRERRAAENVLHNWQGRAWGLPVWMDSATLELQITAGSTSVSIDTTTRDYRVGGLLVVFTDFLTYEVVQIDAIAPGAITLAAPLAATWPAGAEIAPIRAARMPEDVRLQRFTGDASYGRLRFECVDLNDWPAATEATTYRGFPILGQAPDWTEDVEQGFLRKLSRFDPETGPFVVDERGSGAFLLQSHRWLLDGRTEIDAFRRWLYARKGRLTRFWLPTFALDLVVVANIAALGLTIDVEHCGYTATIDEDIGRRDIRIELHTGTVYYRRIVSSVEVSASVERLTIDSALGTLTTPAQIRSVSFMMLARLEADAAEIAWSRADLAESRLVTRGARNDL
jgi:hypothetical protein